MKHDSKAPVEEVAPHTIELEAPVKRGDDEITTVTLRKPNAGSLRGVALTDAVRMDVDAIIKLVPRISSPALTEHEVRQMDAADIFAFGQEIVVFLLPKAGEAA